MGILDELSDQHSKWVKQSGPSKKRTRNKNKLQLDPTQKHIYGGLKQRLFDDHLQLKEHINSTEQLGDYWHWLLQQFNNLEPRKQHYSLERDALTIQLKTLLIYASTEEGRNNKPLAHALNTSARSMSALLNHLETINQHAISAKVKSLLLRNPRFIITTAYKAITAGVRPKHLSQLKTPRRTASLQVDTQPITSNRIMQLVITTKILKSLEQRPELIKQNMKLLQRLPQPILRAILAITQGKPINDTQLKRFFDCCSSERFTDCIRTLFATFAAVIDPSDISTLLFGQLIKPENHPTLTPASAASSVSFTDSDNNDDYRTAFATNSSPH